jgi:nicotinate-nucleotide adenylyltransferase
MPALTPDTAPVAILGGTFDPIHLGHLRIAEEVADALQLEQVVLIPSGHPPHRAPPTFNVEQRLALCQLAVRNNPRFAVDAREIRKATPSFTVETLEQLRAERPDAPLILILGADAFLGLPSWHRWSELLTLAHIAVVSRPGVQLVEQQLPTLLQTVYRERLVATRPHEAVRAQKHGLIVPVQVTALDISATRIRSLLKQGQSVRYLVPDSVLNALDNR